jgi:hypothetical protein
MEGAMPKKILLIAIVGTSIALTPNAAWAAPPYPIADDPKIEERSGAREEGWMAWSELTGAGRVPAFLLPDNGARRRIPVKQSAFVGGIQVSGPRAGQAVFWQFNKKLRGTIRFFDPVSGDVKRAPKKINMTAWSQKSASISGNYLLFGRGKPNVGFQSRVMLYDFSTKQLTRLVGAKGPRFNADQVRGDHAVWTACRKRKCQVFRQTLSTSQRMRIPAAPGKRVNRSAAVDSNGDVYYVESPRNRCTGPVKIQKFDGTGVTTVLALKPGVDAEDLYAWHDGVNTRIVYTRSVCDTFRTGIWEIVA